MQTFWLKRHDLLPPIQATLKDFLNEGILLTSCTVMFHMWLEDSATSKVYAAATIVTPTSGIVRYDWVGTDTDTEGEYAAEWEITYPTTPPKTLTVPNYENDKIVITADATAPPIP